MIRLQKLVDWVKNAREVLDELSVVVQQPEDGAKFLNILEPFASVEQISLRV